MRIVFYSSNSNIFRGEDVDISSLPSRRSGWEAMRARHPRHEFCIATQLPGTFLVDVAGGGLAGRAEGVGYLLCGGERAEDIAAEILALRPELAIAATFWAPPCDWFPLKDAMIADVLRAHGVRCLCHGAETALACFDKRRTHELLCSLGYPVPRALYIHGGLFRCERDHRDMRTNVYREYVLGQLGRLRFPVVLKDTVGLSSSGMEVAGTYRQALAILRSGRTRGDRLAEEYLDGEHFGTEIYGADGRYEVMPPCLFSVNRYGITSPKQSVKLGPVTDGRYHIGELQEMLRRLACDLRLAGVAQVDLVFSRGEWHIIEINPRLSGMTESYAAMLGTPLPQLLLDIALGMPPEARNLRHVLNFKLPIISGLQMEALHALPFVSAVNQIHNKAARQEREKGYAELILSAAGLGELSQAFEQLAAQFPGLMEPVFLRNARALISSLRPPK